jgi:hypothetical protein
MINNRFNVVYHLLYLGLFLFYQLKKKIMITYIANTLFILFILFWVWFIVCSIIYRDKPSNDLNGQSERQKKNDDYNTDYYP